MVTQDRQLNTGAEHPRGGGVHLYSQHPVYKYSTGTVTLYRYGHTPYCTQMLFHWLTDATAGPASSAVATGDCEAASLSHIWPELRHCAT